ncbi:MAG: hydantoinase/carbamoylase family amidase [Proteobacteria bacterium]|nr:hydantoinase/carbamoylase family amidase [Pseudomonadota bacterium]MBI3496899.1 hydantoinase/carbamoylase family amidase [Pseudomonadota bacterium]
MKAKSAKGEPASDLRRVKTDTARLWSRLMALAKIGATAKGGVNRPALSAPEIEAWRMVIGWAGQAGLEPSTDAAGNLFLALPGADRAAAPVLAGSHLDTQPTGGRFDGVYGVLAALETATALAEQGRRPMRDLIVVAWMNEEGSRFASGMMGSEAFAGLRSLDRIRAAVDAEGVSAGGALDALHAAFPGLPRRPLGFPAFAYLEAHIEQGPILEAENRLIGIVTGIQGKKTFETVIEGCEGHAGTMPMGERRDAVAVFARMAGALAVELGDHDGLVKFTIGRLRVEPNAPSVVPARVTFSADLRHPDDGVLTALGERFGTVCRREAAPCAVTVTPLVDAPSNDFDPALQARIERVAAACGYPSMRLFSAAGHDARHLATLCPSAMIFIPCRSGISHAEAEWAECEHVGAGAAVLAASLAELLWQ